MDKTSVSRSSSMDDGIPEAKYTRFGERIRQAIPGPMQCSVGCGGKNCKWENPSRWSDADQAIKGVFSSWVLENVVAMSRPSTEVIKKYEMIDQFKRHNIRSIINLQRPGEHASCGPPLDKESLFTYRPNEFMDNDIFFYNFGWKDYGVTSMHTILDMVKVMSFALEEGKVAIHCHAGLGRTGVLIACYLVYAERMDPASAIITVRKKRSSSIQTRGQIACISEFWQFLRPLRIVFPQVVPHAKRLTLKQFLNRQRLLLHGFESRELRFVPKLVHVVCKRLSEIAHSCEQTDVTDGSTEKFRKRSNTVSDMKQALPGAFVNETNETVLNVLNPASEILKSGPSNADAILSPRVTRHTSERSLSSSDDPDRPRSTGASPRTSIADVFTTENSVEDGVPVSANNTDKITGIESNSVPEVQDSAIADNNDFDEDERIPDEQIDKEVNEILGNSNNNHSIKDNPALVVPLITKKPASKESPDLVASEKSSKTRDEERSSTESSAISSGARLGSGRLPSQQGTPHRNLMRSAGKSDTILPTGLPPKNPRSSAKGKPSSVITTDGARTITGISPDDNSEPAHSKPVNDSDSCRSSPTKDTVAFNPISNTSDAPSVSMGTGKTSVKQKPMFSISDVEFSAPSKSRDDENSDDDEEASTGEITLSGTTTIENPSAEMTLKRELDFSNQTNRTDIGSQLDKTVASIDSVPLQVQDNASNPLKTNDIAADKMSSPDGREDAAFLELKKGSPRKDDAVDVSDDNLDEIIDIRDDSDDGKSFDGDHDEVNLSHSVASRVSWSHTQDGLKPLPADERQFSAASKSSRQSGRTTPLMYRGEKNINLMVDESIVSEDGVTLSKELDSSRDNLPVNDVSPKSCVNSDVDSCSGDDVNAIEAERLARDLNSQHALPRINTTRSLNDLTSHLDSPVALSRCSSSGDMRHPSPHGHYTFPDQVIPVNVALALSYKLIDDEWLWEKVYSLQVEINNHKDAWKTVSEVTDPYLLSALMWTWVEHLSDPVMTGKNITQFMGIIERASPHSKPTQMADTFERALNTLEPSISSTMKCLLTCVSSFPAMPKKISDSIIERLVCAVTHTPMPSVEKNQINLDLERIIDQYVSIKYDITDRKRYVFESSDDVVQKKDSQSQSIAGRNRIEDDVTLDNDVIDVKVNRSTRRSAGSVRSSDCSSAGSSVLTTPRITVN